MMTLIDLTKLVSISQCQNVLYNILHVMAHGYAGFDTIVTICKRMSSQRLQKQYDGKNWWLRIPNQVQTMLILLCSVFICIQTV